MFHLCRIVRLTMGVVNDHGALLPSPYVFLTLRNLISKVEVRNPALASNLRFTNQKAGYFFPV